MRVHKGPRGLGLAAVVLLSVVVLPAQVAAQPPEEFEGLLVSTLSGASGVASIRIRIDEYTTDAETREFIDILANQGWEALEDRFIREEKGRFIRSGQLGLSIAFARSIPHETGRIVRLATARSINFAELRFSARKQSHRCRQVE